MANYGMVYWPSADKAYPPWQLLNRYMTPEALGVIPSFLDHNDPRSAREQFDANYVFGGWDPFPGFVLDPSTRRISYRPSQSERDDDDFDPPDPPLAPLAETKLRDETIILYESAWVLVMQPDGSFEVSRMD